jgi:hypothetical protein
MLGHGSAGLPLSKSVLLLNLFILWEHRIGGQTAALEENGTRLAGAGAPFALPDHPRK